MKAFVLALSSIFFAPVSGLTQPDSLPVAPKKIKILSWNIYMLPAFLGTGKKPRAEMIGQLLAASDYDVIVFQEAFLGSARNTISRLLQPAFPFQAGPANRRLVSLKTNSGIWILSKHPIVKSHSIIFETRRGIDAMSRKGALLTEILFQSQPVQIVGTHLQNAGSDTIRYRQCVELSSLLNKYERLDVPQIVCGDFNIDRYRSAAGYRYMLQLLNAVDGTTTSSQAFSYDRVENDLNAEPGFERDLIDYVLLRQTYRGISGERRIRVFRTPWNSRHQDLSDHFALEADVPLAPAASSLAVASSNQ